MQDYRKITVWQKAHDLVRKLYLATRKFPAEEQYGLTSQMRRSAVSVAANIAEGRGRGTDAEFRRFLSISLGSAMELDYYLLLSADLKLLRSTEIAPLSGLLDEVRRMIYSLIRRLE